MYLLVKYSGSLNQKAASTGSDLTWSLITHTTAHTITSAGICELLVSTAELPSAVCDPWDHSTYWDAQGADAGSFPWPTLYERPSSLGPVKMIGRKWLCSAGVNYQFPAPLLALFYLKCGIIIIFKWVFYQGKQVFWDKSCKGTARFSKENTLCLVRVEFWRNHYLVLVCHDPKGKARSISGSQNYFCF